MVLAMLWGVSRLIEGGSMLPAIAQETSPEVNPADAPEVRPPVEPSADDVDAPTSASSADTPRQRTFLDTLLAGGYIGVIIMLLSMVAVGFIVEHALSIRKSRLMPEAAIDQLEEWIAAGDLDSAIQFCEDPQQHSLATEVILAGLTRFRSSQFGFAEYKSAVEEAGEDYTAGLYRKTDVLSVIGAIAPMLGLFGTVEGMMESFNKIAERGGMARPDELADSIGKALVTTWLGLLVAIPAMVAFSYFRNKIDSIVSECGKRIERVLLPLGRKRS